MIGIIVFGTLQLLASGFAGWRGGAPERVVAAMLVLALVATMLTPMQAQYTYLGLNVPLLRVDICLFAGLVGVALVADRFWPMWLAAVQLVAIGAHGVRVYSPDVVPIAYWWLTAKIAYPMILMLIVGTLRHRARLSDGLPEYGWTNQRRRRPFGEDIA